MVPRGGLDGFWQRENPVRLLGMKPWTILPIAHCYTDYAILAPVSYWYVRGIFKKFPHLFFFNSIY